MPEPNERPTEADRGGDAVDQVTEPTAARKKRFDKSKAQLAVVAPNRALPKEEWPADMARRMFKLLFGREPELSAPPQAASGDAPQQSSDV